MSMRRIAILVVTLGVVTDMSAATRYANSFSRANCKGAMYAGAIAANPVLLSSSAAMPGIKFNESVSWDPLGYFNNSYKHTMQVSSAQYLQVARFVTQLSVLYSPGWTSDSQSRNFPLTWRSYAGRVTAPLSTDTYSRIAGKHDERLDWSTTRTMYTSAGDCNLTQW